MIFDMIEEAIRVAASLGDNAFDAVEGRGLAQMRLAIRARLNNEIQEIGPAWFGEMRGLLLWYFGTTDPELLEDAWEIQADSLAAFKSMTETKP